MREILRLFNAERIDPDPDDPESKGGERRISKRSFTQITLKLAEKIDNRVYPIAISCLMTGTTLGILTPVIPFYVVTMSNMLPPAWERGTCRQDARIGREDCEFLSTSWSRAMSTSCDVGSC